MDKSLIRKRFSRAAKTYPDEAIVQAGIARRMTLIMLQNGFPSHPERVLEFGCGCGGFTACWTACFTPHDLWVNDLCPEVREAVLQNIPKGIPATFLDGDIEQLPLPENLDAILSCSALQWLEQPENFLQRCTQSLHPGSYLVFSTFGPENLREVTRLTGARLPYRSLEEWTSLLQTDYEIVHASEELRQQMFPDPLSVLHHLKKTGVTGIRREKWTQTTLRKFCEQYRLLFSTGFPLSSFSLKNTHSADTPTPPAVRLTYHPLYLMVRKKITKA